MRVDLWLLDANLSKQLRKLTARLAVQAGEGLREQSDQSLSLGAQVD